MNPSSSSLLYNSIGKIPPDEDALAFFSAIAYANTKYLANTSSSSSQLQPVPFITRVPRPDNGDSFFSQTINTDDTVRRALLLVRRDLVELRAPPPLDPTPTTPTAPPDVVALFQLGTKLAGHPDAIHGGLLASLLDEITGFNAEASSVCADVAAAARNRSANPPANNPPANATVRGSSLGRLYTAYLHTSFRRPVPPGVYAVESRLVRLEGRKWFFKAQILGMDGRVYTEAETLFIRARPSAM